MIFPVGQLSYWPFCRTKWQVCVLSPCLGEVKIPAIADGKLGSEEIAGEVYKLTGTPEQRSSRDRFRQGSSALAAGGVANRKAQLNSPIER